MNDWRAIADALGVSSERFTQLRRAFQKTCPHRRLQLTDSTWAWSNDLGFRESGGFERRDEVAPDWMVLHTLSAEFRSAFSQLSG